MGSVTPDDEGPAPARVRVAAIDCGTNSLRLLVADVTSSGPPVLVDVERRMEVVRLGAGVDERGAFSDEALERTLAATDRCAETLSELAVDRVRFVATSASRDASNAHLLLDGVRERLGVPAEVVTGQEEAELSFAGATSGLRGGSVDGDGDGDGGAGDVPHLVVDLGGGSTEMVLGAPGAAGAGLLRSVSMDVGSVRLTERHALSDPPTDEQLAAVRATARAALGRASGELPLSEVGALVGVAGTVTTVAAHALRLPRYDRELLHAAVLPIDEVVTACEDLAVMTRRTRASLPYLHPGRVDVIGAGALLWAEVLRAVSRASGLTEITVSEHDILDGIALRLGACAPAGPPARA